MSKFKSITTLIILLSFLISSCGGNGPEATVLKMKEAACNGDIEEFFSHIDIDNYEKIYRQNEYDKYIESLEEKPSPAILYLDRLYYINSKYFGYDPDDYFLQRDWNDIEEDIKKGESSKICQLEILGPGEIKNSLIVETPFQGKLLWIFKQSWGQYKLIEFDTLDDEDQKAKAAKLMEEFRQSACDGDVKEFFSHIDKEAVARNFKKDLAKKLKTKFGKKYSGWDQLLYYYNYNSYINSVDDTDIENAFSHKYIMNLYETTLWDLLEQDVKMGKESGSCKMETADPDDKSDDFTIEDNSITGAWTMNAGLSDWHITGVNLDSYIAESVEGEINKED